MVVPVIWQKVCTYQWSRFAKEYGAIQHEIALILVLCPSYGKAGWDTYVSRHEVLETRAEEKK